MCRLQHSGLYNSSACMNCFKGLRWVRQHFNVLNLGRPQICFNYHMHNAIELKSRSSMQRATVRRHWHVITGLINYAHVNHNKFSILWTSNTVETDVAHIRLQQCITIDLNNSLSGLYIFGNWLQRSTMCRAQWYECEFTCCIHCSKWASRRFAFHVLRVGLHQRIYYCKLMHRNRKSLNDIRMQHATVMLTGNVRLHCDKQ